VQLCDFCCASNIAFLFFVCTVLCIVISCTEGCYIGFIEYCLTGCFIIVNVHMPKDRITQAHQGYGFVEFMGEEDADYAIKIMNMIKLFGKPIRVNKVQWED